MIKWIKDKIIWFLFGGVCLASGVALLPEKTVIETIIQPVNVLSIKNPKQIEFTDDNTSETLIIKTDREDYSGFNSADVWFSITSQKEETIAIKFLFEENKSSLEKLSKYNKEEITNFLPVYTNEKYNCDYIATTTTKELVKDTCERQIQTATTTETTYKDNWNEIGNTISIDKGTTFFKAFITYPKGTKEKFSIEAIGKSGSYGLLDPTIDGGTYTKYQEVTIDKDEVDANLTDFPVYIDLANLSKAGTDIFDTCRSDGGDIRVTKSDGTTQLAREVVAIDTTAKTGELHFKYKGTLSSTVDTVIRIYYNGIDTEPASDSTYGSEAVWSDYSAVYHMQDTSGGIIDSTGNSNDGGENGNPTYAQTGEIGKAIDLDGTGDYFDADDDTTLDIADKFTISNFFKTSHDYTSEYGGFITKRDGSNSGYRLRTGDGGNKLKGAVYDRSNEPQIFSSDDINDGNWHQGKLTIELDGSNHWKLNLYLDGAFEDTETGATGNTLVNTEPLRIGRADASDRRYIKGIMDEVRIQKGVVQAVTWISTEHSNQSAPSTFYATSDEQGAVSRRIINIE